VEIGQGESGESVDCSAKVATSLMNKAAAAYFALLRTRKTQVLRSIPAPASQHERSELRVASKEVICGTLERW
jgi:hypothetical protein